MRRTALALALVSACGSPDRASPPGSTGSASNESGADATATQSTETVTPTTDTGDATNGPASTTGAGDTAGDSHDSSGTTGDDPAPACAPGDVPGGTLRWSLAGDELPGLLGGSASNAAGDAILGGSYRPTNDLDAWIEVRDPGGALRWTDTYAGVHALDDEVLEIAVDGTGHIHVLVEETIAKVVSEDDTVDDARLVVLRYAPDGGHQWRWERKRDQVPPWGYAPIGRLAIIDDTIVVAEYTFEDDPLAIVTLDEFGNQSTEVALDVLPAWVILGPGGVYTFNHDDGLQAARYGLDGTLVWQASTPMGDVYIEAIAGAPDGGALVAWRVVHDHFVSRYAADGAVTTTLAAFGPLGGDVLAVGWRCDGAPMLGGGSYEPATPDLAWDNRRDLWLAKLADDGAPAWTFTHAFGPPYGHGGAEHITTAPDGDVLVFGTFLVDPGAIPAPWVGRFAGL